MASSIDDYLTAQAGSDEIKRQAAEAVRRFCAASIELRDQIIEGGSGRGLAQSREATNADGDVQKELDVLADRVFMDAAKAAPIAFFGSEEQADPIVLDANAALAVAIDPLDGSSNIETDVSVGTIFSILPVEDAHRSDPHSAFRQPGSKQVAAGFFVYGPQLLLVLSLGQGTGVFLYSPQAGGFVSLAEEVSIPAKASEFAINASNRRHWDASITRYVDDLQSGTEGPRERNFNMRWVGSMVADCYRILQRGGVFLYPGDRREGYAEGRLRLLYEASPVAFVVEQAGGSATDGSARILDIVPRDLHQRVPLVFGGKDEVATVASYVERD